MSRNIESIRKQCQIFAYYFYALMYFNISLTKDQYIYSNFLSFFYRKIAFSCSYNFFFLFRSCSSRSKKVRRLHDDRKSTFTIQRWSRGIPFAIPFDQFVLLKITSFNISSSIRLTSFIFSLNFIILRNFNKVRY